MLTIKRISSLEEFFTLREAWSSLLQRSSLSCIFLTWEWMYTWWKHYGYQHQLWLLTAWSSEELVGIAPFMLVKNREHGIPLRELCFIGTPDIDIGGFILQDGDNQILKAFCDHFKEHSKEWDHASLGEIAENNFSGDDFFAHFTQSCIIQICTTHHFYLSLEGDWDTYFNSLSHHLRGDLRKKTRNLEKQANVSFIRYAGSEVTQEQITWMFQISRHGRYPFLYCNQRQQFFHRELVEIMQAQGWMDISFLFLNDIPVAYRYGFRYNNAYHCWRTAYNTQIEYCKFSIGKILLMFLIEDSFRGHLKEIDFLRGAEEYKTYWKIKHKEYLTIHVISRWFIPMLVLVWIPKLKNPIKRRIETIPWLINLWNHYKQWQQQQMLKSSSDYPVYKY